MLGEDGWVLSEDARSDTAAGLGLIPRTGPSRTFPVSLLLHWPHFGAVDEDNWT